MYVESLQFEVPLTSILENSYSENQSAIKTIIKFEKKTNNF